MLQSQIAGVAQTFGNIPQQETKFRTADGKARVLIVDDSAVVRRAFWLHLADNYECFEAASYDEALAEMRINKFEVVITDIIMPGMSGIELLRKIVEDFPDTEVVVVSGVDRSQRALDAIRLGAFDYLIKPCEPDVLEVTVERALERRRLLINSRLHEVELETQNAELLRRKEQLERLQGQVIHSEKMASLGQLAAGVAHELNNPVGFVSANLELLDQMFADLGKTDLDKEIDEIRSILNDCREGSVRIRDIVRNLRTFSRLDEAEFNETDIHEGIDATLRLLPGYFSSGKITVHREYGDLPLVGGFSSQLNQVWMNLLINAAQAIGDETGVISIKTMVENDEVVVKVADTGCGIAVQHLKKIFDPLFTTKAIGEGTGLGLSISFGIVERHGGNISVNSRLNKGTTFEVRIPKKFSPDHSEGEKSIACFTGD